MVNKPSTFWIMLPHKYQSCVHVTKWQFILMCIFSRAGIPEHLHNYKHKPTGTTQSYWSRQSTNMKLHVPLDVSNSDNTQEISTEVSTIITFPTNTHHKQLPAFTWVTCLPTGYILCWHHKVLFFLVSTLFDTLLNGSQKIQIYSHKYHL